MERKYKMPLGPDGKRHKVYVEDMFVKDITIDADKLTDEQLDDFLPLQEELPAKLSSYQDQKETQATNTSVVEETPTTVTVEIPQELSTITITDKPIEIISTGEDNTIDFDEDFKEAKNVHLYPIDDTEEEKPIYEVDNFDSSKLMFKKPNHLLPRLLLTLLLVILGYSLGLGIAYLLGLLIAG